MKLKLALVLAAFAAACSGTPQPQEPAPARDVTPPPPAAVDPVGVFDFTTTVEGMGAVNGTITITKNPAGGYGGTIGTNVTETITIRTVTVDGQKVNVVADTPDGPITFTMEFTGNDFTGTWTLGGMSGVHTGKRRTS